MATKLVRLPTVLAVTGLSRSSVLNMSKLGTLDFPKSFKIGQRAVAWKADEIEHWVKTRSYSQKEKAK